MLFRSSRYVRAGSWPTRLVWGGLTAAAWGQLAAAHFSVGLIIGTGAVLAYMLAKVWENTRSRTWSRGRGLLLVFLLVCLFGVINLAYLLPRLAYMSETSLGLGYTKLDALAVQLAGLPARAPPLGATAGPAWPLKLATPPGAYAGLALALSFAGFCRRSEERRVGKECRL